MIINKRKIERKIHKWSSLLLNRSFKSTSTNSRLGGVL